MTNRRHRDQPPPGGAADVDPDADPESVARAIVLRRLSAAPRTRAQLTTDLERRGVPSEVSQRVLDRFSEVGLVDDAAFANSWVRSRQINRGLSRRALAHELRQRGVADDVLAVAVADVGDDDEHNAAAALVAKRLPSLRGLDRQVQIRRLAGMLARKGYSSALAMQVVREALREATPANC